MPINNYFPTYIFSNVQKVKTGWTSYDSDDDVLLNILCNECIAQWYPMQLSSYHMHYEPLDFDNGYQVGQSFLLLHQHNKANDTLCIFWLLTCSSYEKILWVYDQEKPENAPVQRKNKSKKESSLTRVLTIQISKVNIHKKLVFSSQN